MHHAVCRSLIIAHLVDGKPPVKYGNRHPYFAPIAFSLCRTGSWILAPFRMMPCGRSSRNCWPCRLGRGRSAGERGRAAPDRERTEAAIAAWTSARDPQQAMNQLQLAGVAAGVARLPIELLRDPQLHARGFIQEVDRAFIGKHPQPSMPFRETETPFPSAACRRRSASITAKCSAACWGCPTPSSNN